PWNHPDDQEQVCDAESAAQELAKGKIFARCPAAKPEREKRGRTRSPRRRNVDAKPVLGRANRNAQLSVQWLRIGSETFRPPAQRAPPRRSVTTIYWA